MRKEHFNMQVYTKTQRSIFMWKDAQRIELVEEEATKQERIVKVIELVEEQARELELGAKKDIELVKEYVKDQKHVTTLEE